MPLKKEGILITGANGQLGSELCFLLGEQYPECNIIRSDLYAPQTGHSFYGEFEHLDVLDKDRMKVLIKKHHIVEIYHLAALLSATCESKPRSSWNLNVTGLLNVLDCAVEFKLKKVFWPSSIAVFGPAAPRHNTPQYTYLNPTSIYGISKMVGERWCEYYQTKHGVDVRSLRYPGVISYKTPPGGGTTDYAVDIFHHAIAGKNYISFLSEDTFLPMMYIPDALKATQMLMRANRELLTVKGGYNLTAMSFSPKLIAAEIQSKIPGFGIAYHPDFRQKIADSWPKSIDDQCARADWGWQPDFDISKMTRDMIASLSNVDV